MTIRHELGQHFLTNRHLIGRIIAVIDPHPDELIIEVGPGRGALTFPLAAGCGRLIALEKDAGLIPALLADKPDNVVILEQDVLEADFSGLVHGQPGPWAALKIAGNLPYSISSPFLFKLLDEPDPPARGVFLLQKEVAERVAAGPGSKKRAPMSVLFDLDYRVRLEFTLPPGAFSPPPRVHSALVSLDKRAAPLSAVGDRRGFRRLLRAAFAERRKTLANNLKKAGFPAEAVRRAVAGLSLPETVRAEEIDTIRFVDLFAALRPR